MPLDFQKTTVSPGEPVTADAWNAIVDGLFEVQSAVKMAGPMAKVRLNSTGLDLSTARVTASRGGDLWAEAMRPIPPSKDFVFTELKAGTYEIRAAAPGWQPKTGQLEVAGDATENPPLLELVLVAEQVTVMPEVLGLELKKAAQKLTKIKTKVLDAGGKVLSVDGIPSAYKDKPVIMQWPLPDEVVPPTGCLVVVAAVIQHVQLVTVPSLFNLTSSEAEAALAELGLKLRIVQ